MALGAPPHGVVDPVGPAAPGGPSLQVPPAHHRKRPWWWPRRAEAYVLVLPCIAVIGILVIYPLVLSAIDSLRNDSAIDPSHAFVGLHNYSTVFSDPAFQHAALNTLVYLLISTVGSLIVGWVVAAWLHSLKRWRAVFLAVIILPWAVPGTVNGVLWSFILNPTNGLLNDILMRMHLISHDVVWLAGSTSGLIAIGISLVWQTAPITAIILLAGIESIPGQLYEQAAVDGASHRNVYFRITTPLLRPALAIALMQAGVLGIAIFDQVYVLSGYSPTTSSALLQVYLYAFQDFNFGVGMAASIIVTIVTLMVSLFYLKVVYREIEM